MVSEVTGGTKKDTYIYQGKTVATIVRADIEGERNYTLTREGPTGLATIVNHYDDKGDGHFQESTVDSTGRVTYTKHDVLPEGGYIETISDAKGNKISPDSINWHGSASEAFFKSMKEQLLKLPEDERRLLARFGTTVTMADRVANYDPLHRNDRPQGWVEGYTVEDIQARYYWTPKTLILAEKVRNNPFGLPTSPVTPIDVWHEFGHALDHALKEASHSDNFINAYKADVAAYQLLLKEHPEKISNWDKATMRYLLEPKPIGQEESFAVAFSELNCAIVADNKKVLPSFAVLKECGCMDEPEFEAP